MQTTCAERWPCLTSDISTKSFEPTLDNTEFDTGAWRMQHEHHFDHGPLAWLPRILRVPPSGSSNEDHAGFLAHDGASGDVR